jgi:hypothetical protein
MVGRIEHVFSTVLNSVAHVANHRSGARLTTGEHAGVTSYTKEGVHRSSVLNHFGWT